MQDNYSSQAIHRLRQSGAAFNRWKLGTDREKIDGNVSIVASSISGHERNHIFFNSPTAKFEDLSGLSGLDSVQDSRVFALLDFDRDGWQDMAVVNSNYPLLNVYRNRLGELQARHKIARNTIAIRLVGGNHSPKPNSKYAARDGYGAIVKLQAGDLSLIREHRCGAGMGAQNSNTILIGIGENELAESLTVIWPSGKEQPFENLQAGTLITVYENPQQSPTKKAAIFENYLKNIPVKNIAATIKPVSSKRLDFEEFAAISSPAKMRIFTSIATYCKACKKKLPQVEQIRNYFSQDDVEFLGVPVDRNDLVVEPDNLVNYLDIYQPRYELMRHLSESAQSRFKDLAVHLLGFQAEPLTIVTDDQGTIFYAEPGVPNISTLKKLLKHLKSRQAE